MGEVLNVRFVMGESNDKALSLLEQCFSTLYPFRSALCELLTLPELCLLSSTSVVFKCLLEREIGRSQDVERLLSFFFKDSRSFRLMLRDTGGVLFGDFSRSFFMRDRVPHRLDILVVDRSFYSGRKMNRWIRYLTKKEGYSMPSVTGRLWQRATQVMGFWDFF